MKVILLHGFLGRGDDWARVVAHLEGCFQTVAPDLPGHGTAIGLAPSEYGMDPASSRIAALLRAAGPEERAVVGYSMGGRLALHLALRYPDLVDRLVLLSASPGIADEEERRLRREADRRRAEEIRADLPAFLQRWYRMPLFASLTEETRQTLVAKRSRNDPEELCKSLETMGTGMQAALWDGLESIPEKAFVLAGELDQRYVDIAHRMTRLSTFRKAIVPDAGHALLYERPRKVAELLSKILSS